MKHFVAVPCLLCSTVAVLLVTFGDARLGQSENTILSLIAVPSRRNSRGPKEMGCYLSGRHYDLEQTFHPVMYSEGKTAPNFCALCKCFPKYRKQELREQGRLECKPLSAYCKPLPCKNAYIPTGRCCKVCKSNDTNGEPPRINPFAQVSQVARQHIRQEARRNPAAEEPLNRRGRRHYSAHLVPTRSSGVKRSRAVALAQTTLAKKNLHYSIKFGGLDENNRITKVRFIIKQHRKKPRGRRHPKRPRGFRAEKILLRQFEVSESEAANKLLCGVFANIPNLFIRYLDNNRLIIELATTDHPNGEMIGNLTEDEDTGRPELFHSILTSPPLQDVGPMPPAGIALIKSAYAGYRTPALDMHLFFYGDFQHVLRDRPKQRFRLAIISQQPRKTIFEQQVTLNSQERERVIQIRSKYPDTFLAAKGTLQLIIYSRNNKKLLEGYFTPAISCDVYVAALADYPAMRSFKMSKSCTSNLYGGYGLFKVNPSGSVAFKIGRHWSFGGDIAKMELQKNRGRTVLRLFSRGSPVTANMSANVIDGVVSGLTIHSLQQLLSGRLYLSVVNSRNCVMRGRISVRHFTTYGDVFKTPPTIMTAAAVRAPVVSSAAALAYFSFDASCTEINYEVHWVDSKSKVRRRRKGKPKRTLILKWDDANGMEKVVALKKFNKDKFMGRMHYITSALADAFNSANVMVRIDTKENKNGELQAILHVPNRCAAVIRKATSDSGDDENAILKVVKSCTVDNQRYKDGQPIKANVNKPCEFCVCTAAVGRGIKKCRQMQCVKPKCPVAERINISGVCCPICNSSLYRQNVGKPKCRDRSTNRHYPVGATFHPYLHPSGFATCVECYCSNKNGELKSMCKKKKCPPLSCPVKNQMIGEGECCPKCVQDPSVKMYLPPEDYEKFPINLPSQPRGHGKGPNMAQDNAGQVCRGRDSSKKGDTIFDTNRINMVEYHVGDTWKWKMNVRNINLCIQCTCVSKVTSDGQPAARSTCASRHIDSCNVSKGQTNSIKRPGTP